MTARTTAGMLALLTDGLPADALGQISFSGPMFKSEERAFLRDLLSLFDGAWTDWVPVADAGTMTLVGIAFTKARYRIVGKTLMVAVTSNGFTTGGAATASINFTLPANV